MSLPWVYAVVDVETGNKLLRMQTRAGASAMAALFDRSDRASGYDVVAERWTSDGGVPTFNWSAGTARRAGQ